MSTTPKFKVSSVKYIEYYSNEVSKEDFTNFIMLTYCDSEGTLTLNMRPHRVLTTTGPRVIPSIRWQSSFEEFAQFIVECEVKKVEE